MQHELHPRARVLQIHEQVPGLLDDPGPDRMLCGAQDPDAPVAVLDYRKDVHLRAIEQVSGEQVQCFELLAKNSTPPGQYCGAADAGDVAMAAPTQLRQASRPSAAT
jgi:hypothetical protein